MSDLTIYYLPCLHSELLPADLAETVLCIPCYYALWGTQSLAKDHLSKEKQEAIENFCTQLPLDPAQSRATLEETLRIGNNLPPENLHFVEFAPAPTSSNLSYAELDSLKSFETSGETPTPDFKQQSTQDLLFQKINAQKSLLLGWQLEEYALSINQLHAKIAEKQRKLQEAIGEDPNEEPIADSETDDPFENKVDQGLPWKLILESSLAFLPENAMFFVQEQRIITELMELELPQEELSMPGSLMRWSMEKHTPLRGIKTNLMKLFGSSAANLPWLHKEFFIFFPNN